MRAISRRECFACFGGIVAANLVGPFALVGACFLCRKPIVDMPISLALGTIRTPDFAVKDEAYAISIRVERKLPPAELNCMMGVKPYPWIQDHCADAPI